MKKIRKQLTAALLLTMCIIGGFQAPVLAYYYNRNYTTVLCGSKQQ